MKEVTTPSGRKVIQLEPGDYRVWIKGKGFVTPWLQGKK